MTALHRAFYARDPREVAPELLNKLLEHDGRSGRIVEVEAYVGGQDPASHAYRGPTKRNATMFGPPGHLYVYLSYGMHWCANVTCGDGLAVLLRALSPVAGIEAMRAARSAASRDRDLASGPGKLTQALGITGVLDGADLVEPDRGVCLVSDGTPPPDVVVRTPRIGITAAAEHEWRFYVPGDPNVSRPLIPRVRP